MISIGNILTRMEDSALIRRLFGLLPGPLRRLLNSQRNFLYALLVHALFLSIFVVSFDWTAKPVPSATPKVNVIAAVAVDEARVQVELDKLKKAEQQRQKQDDARQRKLKKEEKHLAELKKKKAIEQRRLQEQQKKRQVEEKKAKELALKKKTETEKLNKLKKEQAVLKKEQTTLENKRKAEQKRLAELENKRKVEAARVQKKKEEQQRREAEQALQKQLAEEQQALEAEHQRQSNRVLNQYVEIIKQKVTRNWLRPSGAPKGLSCIVAVSLIPGGEVLNARVTRGSGDPVFDRSVESAVLKASPLPLPPDASMFERFRELEFIFDPEG